MNRWTPLLISILIVIIINAFPLVMAFVIEKEGWVQGGWAFYFYIIPASIIILLVGLIVSLKRFFA